jgi:hypothetical protein
MSEQHNRQVEIGFGHGSALRLRLDEPGYDELRRLLSDGGGSRWHELDAADATVTLDLSQVVYLRLDTEPGRVGF